jgi:predicted RNase H-like nuclease (RuvC/YqgF family)
MGARFSPKIMANENENENIENENENAETTETESEKEQPKKNEPKDRKTSHEVVQDSSYNKLKRKNEELEKSLAAKDSEIERLTGELEKAADGIKLSIKAPLQKINNVLGF